MVARVLSIVAVPSPDRGGLRSLKSLIQARETELQSLDQEGLTILNDIINY